MPTPRGPSGNPFADLLRPEATSPVVGVLQRVLHIDELHRIHDDLLHGPADGPFFDRLLKRLNVGWDALPADLSRIPKAGALVAVANHPFGLIEGAVLGAVLASVRPDVKIMANFLLASLPATGDWLICVDPFGGPGSVQANRRGLRDSIEWLEHGGALAVFPAGEVAHVDLKKRTITDPAWSESVARLVRRTHATALPIYFSGANGPMFQILGLIHPQLRTAFLPHELLNKRHNRIEVRIGNPVPPKRAAEFQDDAELIAYLRHRTFFLKHRDQPKGGPARVFSIPRQKAEPIAPVAPDLLAADISALPPEQTLVESGEHQVLLAAAHQLPNVLCEIGRLREVTFRQVGEGTGKSIDLDSFDAHYLHLFIWQRSSRQVIGAYRLGATDDILPRFGMRGLYTSTLFDYKHEFLDKIGPAVELGRSFVRPEAQRDFAPLLCLWKGIGAYVARFPHRRMLFGPVSISNDYQLASRQLMVTFFRAQNQACDLARLVKARAPFRARPVDNLIAGDIDELSTWIADIEEDQKGVPILIKQYLKLGGRLLSFNVDSSFSNVIDGLILVDLTQTDTRMLDRYLGKDGTARFLEYHRYQRLLAS